MWCEMDYKDLLLLNISTTNYHFLILEFRETVVSLLIVHVEDNRNNSLSFMHGEYFCLSRYPCSLWVAGLIAKRVLQENPTATNKLHFFINLNKKQLKGTWTFLSPLHRDSPSMTVFLSKLMWLFWPNAENYHPHCIEVFGLIYLMKQCGRLTEFEIIRVKRIAIPFLFSLIIISC